MNHTISHRQFKDLVRGKAVTLDGGDQIALADIGYAMMRFEINAAAAEGPSPWNLAVGNIPTRAAGEEILKALEFQDRDCEFRLLPASRSLLTFQVDGFLIEKRAK